MGATNYATAIINSDVIFTSAINVQGHQYVNVGIYIGSAVSAPTVSALSATITLERQMVGDPDELWREVNSWAVAAASGLDGGIEDITDRPEPETCVYRLGCKAGEYDSGLATIRIGSS